MLPKINVYTIVWNEEFMLPAFLEHYSQVANRIFVVDDHSTDRTPEIAKSHPLVTYIEYPYEGLDEQQFSETFRRLAKQHPADLAVCVDGDEFIQGLADLNSPFKAVLKTKGYMMIGRTGKLEDCKKVRMKTFDKPVVLDPTLDFHFGNGRHTIDLPTEDSNLELWHYKYPSREYYLKRNTESYKRIAGMDEHEQDKRIKMGLAWYDAHA